MTDPSGHVSSWLRFDRAVRRRTSPRGDGPTRAPEADAAAHAAGAPPVPDTLRGIYARYCEHEARELLTLMPRDAFRELYRTARRLAQEGDRELAEALDEGGPMDLAALYAGRRLPLPPYEAWVRSYRSNRTAFLSRLGMESAPSRDEPVTVSVRPIGDGWYAALCVVRLEDQWSGSIRFHRVEGTRAWSTTNVFRADEVDEIRGRFRSFDDDTLRAFLRSVLP